jgi:SAM-dependent methyltransferase
MSKISVPEQLNRNAPQIAAIGPEKTGTALIELATRKMGRQSLCDADVLDIGCGVRFTQAMLNCNIPIGTYTGVDVDSDVIGFLQREVTDPRFRFAWWDVRNELYHRGGQVLTRDTALPVDDTLDVIWLFSVFTHLHPVDADALLAILRRHLRPRGDLFFSAFIDNQVDGFEDRVSGSPLLEAYYSEAYMRELLRAQGWEVVTVDPPAQWVQHQFLCRLPQPVHLGLAPQD